MKRVLRSFVIVGSVLPVLVLVMLAAVVYPHVADRLQRTREIADRENVVLPDVESTLTRKQIARNVRQPPVREEVNWDVPFTPQAPFAVWDPDHKEACEEASALMVLRYFAGKPLESPEDADAELLRLVRKNEQEFGYPVDQTAQQVAQLIVSENKDLTVSVVAEPTEQSIKEALNLGMLVVLPVAGRQLHNPYFQRPGPPYHMLVIRGYTKDGYVITNDPGTKRGEQFTYRWDTLLHAIHDWNGGDVENGERVAIVVGPFIPWEM